MSTVTEFLRAGEIEFLRFEHDRTPSATFQARSLGIAPGIVAKTIVLDTAAGHALALIPASARLDMKRVAAATGDPHVRLSSEHEIAEDFPGFELGAIPPMPGLLEVPLFVDRALIRQEAIVFASGRQTESVKMHTVDLLAQPNVTVVSLSRVAFDGDWTV